MNRRGFFSNITSWFSSRKEGDPLFFGVQCVVNVGTEDELRANLHRVIGAPGSVESPGEKFLFYRRISALLHESLPFMEYGYWDFLTDEDEAVEEFESWVAEIEGAMAIVEEETVKSADDTERISSERNYVVVSMAFLLEEAPSLMELHEAINAIPEEEYFSPTGFKKLIDAVALIDFDASLGDAVFIMPGNEEDGFSWTDLHGEGWEYLKPLMGNL